MPRMSLIGAEQNENCEGATWQSMPLAEGRHPNMDNAPEIFLQMGICRFHGKLGKELVVHQCFWSLAHYSNKPTEQTGAVYELLKQPRSHSQFWSSLAVLSYPKGKYTGIPKVHFPSSLLLLTQILSLHLPQVFFLQSPWFFLSYQVPPPIHLLTPLSLLLGQRSPQSLPSLSSIFSGYTGWEARHGEDLREHTAHQWNDHVLPYTEAR